MRERNYTLIECLLYEFYELYVLRIFLKVNSVVMRHVKIKALIWAIIMSLFSVQSLFAQSLREDTVIFELTQPIANPINFNWFFPGSHRDYGAHQVMWEPLFLLDYATGELEPWLAESMVADASQQVWTLKLRPGIKWSDGKPFTADDVVFTVDLSIDHSPDLGCKTPYLPAMEAVKMCRQVASVEKVADGNKNLTVRFVLKAPNPRFKLDNFGAARFSSFLIMPKHVWSKVKNPQKNLKSFPFNPPIGTGPYKLKAASEKEVVWERNDAWWGVEPVPDGPDADKLPDAEHRFRPLPEPKQLIWRYVPDTASKEALRTNEIDAARPYSFEDFEEVRRPYADGTYPPIVGWNDTSPIAWNDPCPRQLEINVAHQIGGKDGPWAGVEGAALRRSLSLLIDRKALADGVYGTGGASKSVALPSSTMFADYGALGKVIGAIKAAGDDVAPGAKTTEAEGLLAAAGYAKQDGYYQKDGKELSATIAVLDEDDRPEEREAAEALVAQLNAFGIKAATEKFSKEKYWGEIVPKGLYEMTYSWLSCGSIAEPWTSLDRYTGNKVVPVGDRSPGFSNTGRWKNDAFSAAVTELAKIPPEPEQDPAKEAARLSKLKEHVTAAYRELSEDMPVIPLIQSPAIIAFSEKHWTGWPSAEACKPQVVASPPAAGGTADSESNPRCMVPMHSWAATHRLIHSLRAP
jgi:peptide/nickel transport system substrate-binding protein